MVRPEVQEAIKSIKNVDSSEFVLKLMQVTSMLQSHRERSAQEVAFVACGLPLRGSYHTVVFVNTLDRSPIDRT